MRLLLILTVLLTLTFLCQAIEDKPSRRWQRRERMRHRERHHDHDSHERQSRRQHRDEESSSESSESRSDRSRNHRGGNDRSERLHDWGAVGGFGRIGGFIDRITSRDFLIPDFMAPLLEGSIDFDIGGKLGKLNFRHLFNKRKNEWWKGPNICISKTESNGSAEAEPGDRPPHQVATQSICDQSDTVYKCTTSLSFFGETKTYTVTYECCHGYQREEGKSGCTKALELTNTFETLEKSGASQYALAVRSLGLEPYLRDGNFTIFAPSDEAMRKILPDETRPIAGNHIVVDAEAIQAAERLMTLVKAHIVPDFMKTSDMEDEKLHSTMEDGVDIRTNVYNIPKKVTTINCMKLNTSDVIATNGVVHVIDHVLQPVEDSLTDLISRMPELTVLKTILGKTGIASQLRKDGQYTVFAPTDHAFNKLEPRVRDKLLGGETCLSNVIKHHMLPNVICSSIVETKARTKNHLDKLLSLARDEEERLQVEGVQVLVTDIMATNGVLHLIDEVLVPEEAQDVEDIARQKGATTFLNYVRKAQLSKTLQTSSDMTIFVPSNQAFIKLPQTVKDEWEKDPEEMIKALKYHVIPSEEKYHDLRNNRELETLSEGEKVTLKTYHTVPFGRRRRKVVQCSPIKQWDIQTCNGIIHMIDDVLLPPKGDVFDILTQDERFSKLAELLKKSGLAEDLQRGPYTLIAPTNEAFDKVYGSSMTRLTNDAEKLKGFLQMHILPNIVCCAGVFDGMFHAKPRDISLDGTLVSFELRDNDNVYVNSNIPIQECDITASNGVIHAVDHFINGAWERYGRHGNGSPSNEESSIVDMLRLWG